MTDIASGQGKGVPDTGFNLGNYVREKYRQKTKYSLTDLSSKLTPSYYLDFYTMLMHSYHITVDFRSDLFQYYKRICPNQLKLPRMIQAI